MVKVTVGDLFSSSAQTLTNTVNRVGVMGKGIALGFKERFPDMYDDYVERCRRNEVQLGQPYLFKRLVLPWILVFPTKDHWRSASRVEDIANGLDYLEGNYREWGITALAVPPLGCGQGGLEWSVVGPVLYQKLRKLDIPVELYAPFDVQPEQLSEEFLLGGPGSPHLAKAFRGAPVGIVAVIEVIRRLRDEGHRRPIGHVLFQKLAYFVNALGLPTGTHFVRSAYGPFSRDVKTLAGNLINNGLLVEERRREGFAYVPGSNFERFKKTVSEQFRQQDETIAQITDLFSRLDTRKAELATAVHFVAKELGERLGSSPSVDIVVDEIRNWKARRRQPFPTEMIVNCVLYMAAARLIKVSEERSKYISVEEELVANT